MKRRSLDTCMYDKQRDRQEECLKYNINYFITHPTFDNGWIHKTSRCISIMGSETVTPHLNRKLYPFNLRVKL